MSKVSKGYLKVQASGGGDTQIDTKTDRQINTMTGLGAGPSKNIPKITSPNADVWVRKKYPFSFAI